MPDGKLMTETELRQVLVSALEGANVFGLEDESRKRSFVMGVEDIAFADLEIDSLATMQFCIAIESSTGVSVAPRELERFRSLGELSLDLLTKSD